MLLSEYSRCDGLFELKYLIMSRSTTLLSGRIDNISSLVLGPVGESSNISGDRAASYESPVVVLSPSSSSGYSK